MMKLRNLIALGILGVLTLGVGIGVASHTNVNKVEAIATASPYSHIFEKSQLTDNGGNVNLSGVEWTYDSMTYCGFDGNNRGVQIGSNKNPQKTEWTIRTSVDNFGGTITNITVNACTGGSATLNIYSDGSPAYNSALSSTSMDYALDLSTSPTNEIKIGMIASSKAMYIKSIVVEFISTDLGDLQSLTYVGTPVQQYVGKSFNSTGLTFTANYENKSIELLNTDIIFTPEEITTDTSEITATYQTVSTTITGFEVIELNTTTYYFKDGFNENDGFQNWDTGYEMHELQYNEVNVKWNEANKQTSTITDMPVSKNCDVIFQSTRIFKYLEVSFKQWLTKTQTIELKINGSVVETLNFPSGGTSISWIATDEKVNEIVLTTKTANQIGWEYFVVELGEDAASGYTQEAATWAKSFNADMGEACIADGSTDLELLNTAWSLAKLSYDTLSVEAKEYLKTVTLETSDNTDVTKAISLYDYVYKKYNTQLTAGNFLQRDLQVVSSSITNVPTDNTMLIIIVVISILSVSSIALFAISKRKAIRK